MSTTVLRLGLWIMILVLALYVIDARYADKPIADLIPTPMLQQALILSVALVVIGIFMRIFRIGASVGRKNRCQVCRTPIPPGAIYCRAHLRSILHEEDDKTHMTRTRR